MLQRSAERFGNRIAVSLGERHLSYKELDAASNKIARALTGAGVKSGDRAVILAENSPEYVAAYFGIVKTGVIAVLLDSKYKLPELTALFKDAEPKAVFGEEGTLRELVPKLSEFPTVKLVIDLSSKSKSPVTNYREIIAGEPGDRLEFEPESQALANINYTSGPTFNPRGVMLTHEHLVKSAAIYHDFMQQTENDVFIQFALPDHHVVGLSAVMLTAAYGGSRVVMLPGLSTDALFNTIVREKGTIFMGVPFIYTLMMQAVTGKPVKHDLSSLRHCIVGASPTPVELMAEFEKLFGKKMIQFYGLTEANAFVTCQSVSGKDKPGSVGRALSGWEIKIVDSNGRQVPTNHEGEILVSGLIMEGYYKSPEANAATLKDGWFRTGDLGKFDEDGELYITGRLKNMIKVKGQNIYPSDIEAVLSKHPAVAEVKVTGAPDEMRGEIVKAMVRLKEDTKATEEELRHFCLPYIANYKIPRRVEFT